MRAVLLPLAVAACLHAPVFADDPRQTPQQLNATVKVEMNYLLGLPRDYGTKDSWPLVLFLHGAGERGNDLELVKMHGPPKLIGEGKDFPFIVVSPQCPEGVWWEPIELTALLDQVIKACKVDEDRIYVTGLSMGGSGTWRLAAYTPFRFAAIAPICGGGEPHWARRFPHLATWAFHGARDQGVPLERTQEMIDAMRAKGGEPRLTVYPEAGHDSWTKTYNNPAFYEWLLEQKRKPVEDQARSLSTTCRIIRHGFPAATTPSGMSPVTTLPAPITDFEPTFTPGRMIAPPPTQTSEPIETGLPNS